MSYASGVKWIAVGLLAGGLVAAGGGRIDASEGAGRAPEGAKADPIPAGARTIAELAEARIQAAQKALAANQAFFDQGTINIDRLIAASQHLMESERDAARTKADEIAPLRSHLERMKKIEERERSRFEVGSGSIPNVSEAEYHRTEAEYWLARAQAGLDAGNRDRPEASRPAGGEDRPSRP